MTRRLVVPWPDPRPFAARAGRPIRLLAASDEADPTLSVAVNRENLAPIDLVIGCGDLSPDWLGFLGDAFLAPLVFVRGNHDNGGPWPTPREVPMPSAGMDGRSLPGIDILALPWPRFDARAARRDEGAAWRQLAGVGLARLVWPARSQGLIVVSHVPPRGVGDTPGDPYHVGFAAYEFISRRMQPRLWLHGHTSLAAQPTWRVQHGPTTVVNATGSVLIQLTPAPRH